MSIASMSFGRPQASPWTRFARETLAAVQAIGHVFAQFDRWLDSPQDQPRTADEVLAYARHIEASDPGMAADLRCAALRTLR
jgi:hypothetical protein